jgi:hypothetical protein
VATREKVVGRQLKCHLQSMSGESVKNSARTITDAERADKSMGGIVGKRLTYQRPYKSKERF